MELAPLFLIIGITTPSTLSDRAETFPGQKSTVGLLGFLWARAGWMLVDALKPSLKLLEGQYTRGRQG